MLTAAASAMAYDAPVPGTADAPAYYLIEANRGVPYLTYSAQTLTSEKPVGTTNLYRANETSVASIWQITAGKTDSTIVVKNYSADAYLMSFWFADGDEREETTVVNSLADVAKTPTEIFTKQMPNGAYALSLKNSEGGSYEDDDMYTLDATGGESTFCGNYVPDQGGACWWFTRVEVAPGQSIEDALAAVAMKPMIEEAINEINIYIDAVPAVKAELQAGIDKIKAIVPSASAIDLPTKYKEEAFVNANAALALWMTKQPLALESLRRVALQSGGGAYICSQEGEEVFGVTSDIMAPEAAWTFTQVEGGVIAYNKAIEKYVGKGQAPVDVADSAQVVTPKLATGGEYVGVSLPIVGGEGQGWNINSYASDTYGASKLTQWSAADAGSIWNLVAPSSEYAMQQYIDGIEAAFTPYIANVPMVAGALNAGIEAVKALTYGEGIDEKVAEIKEDAMANANDTLATCLANNSYIIKYLRGNDYLSIGVPEKAEDEDEIIYIHAATAQDAQSFTFVPAEDGAYYVYNATYQAYVGTPESYTYVNENPDANSIFPAASKEAAEAVRPTLWQNGDFYGVAFLLDEEGVALNMNSGNNLKSYTPNDGGSIFAIVDPSQSGICAPVVAPVVEGIYDLQGRRLAAPQRGINIINGRKVLVK